jgi:hypothetical protein
MNQHDSDPLHAVLSEWEAPPPPAPLDARVLAAYRATARPTLWMRIWSFRVSIPVPVLAALLLVISAAFWLQFRSRPTAPQAAPSTAGYMTRLETAGYRPLPDGAVRVIRAGEKKQ